MARKPKRETPAEPVADSADFIDTTPLLPPPVIDGEEIFHPKASCRWCGGRFRRVYGFQWMCENYECAAKQMAHGVERPCRLIGKSPYLFLPLPFQVDVEEYQVRRLLVHGPRGISKSYFSRWYGYKRCLKIPGFRVLLLRRTYDQLNKNHMQFIEDEAKALGDDKVKWTSGNVRQLVFFHGDDPDAIMFMGFCQDEGDISQFVGPEYDLILLEEGVTLLPKAIREISACDRGAATSRPFREKIGLKGQTRIITNPGGIAMNYLNDFYIAKRPDSEEFRTYRPEYYGHMNGDVRDNPYLDDDYEDASLGHLDATRHAQLAAGRWDVFEGQFFPQFNPEKHVRTA